MICNGTPIKNALLTVRKAGGKEKVKYLVMTMTQSIITSLSVGGDGGGDRLIETLSFNFATVKYEYTPQKSDGSAEPVVTTGWNIAGNSVL